MPDMSSFYLPVLRVGPFFRTAYSIIFLAGLMRSKHLHVIQGCQSASASLPGPQSSTRFHRRAASTEGAFFRLATGRTQKQVLEGHLTSQGAVQEKEGLSTSGAAQAKCKGM